MSGDKYDPPKKTLGDQEQRIIRDILLMHKQGNNFTRIAKTLNDRKIVAKRRGKKLWHNSFIRNVIMANNE